MPLAARCVAHLHCLPSGAAHLKATALQAKACGPCLGRIPCEQQHMCVPCLPVNQGQVALSSPRCLPLFCFAAEAKSRVSLTCQRLDSSCASLLQVLTRCLRACLRARVWQLLNLPFRPPHLHLLCPAIAVRPYGSSLSLSGNASTDKYSQTPCPDAVPARNLRACVPGSGGSSTSMSSASSASAVVSPSLALAAASASSWSSNSSSSSSSCRSLSPQLIFRCCGRPKGIRQGGCAAAHEPELLLVQSLVHEAQARCQSLQVTCTLQETPANFRAALCRRHIPSKGQHCAGNRQKQVESARLPRSLCLGQCSSQIHHKDSLHRPFLQISQDLARIRGT